MIVKTGYDAVPLRIAAPLMAGCLLLAGCVGSPTYGTGKPADQQLLEDVTNVFTITPDKSKERIDYKPRPALVKPAPEVVKTGALPEPQQAVATTENPAWPESPEQRRLRLRAEATENRNDPNFEPAVENDLKASTEPVKMVHRTRGESMESSSKLTSTRDQRADFNRRLVQSQQGSPTERRYLSEPPLEYRQAAATAPTNDVGEDEWRKENRRKAAARKKSGKRSWRNILPW